jgi:hypothetical protein
MAIGNFEPYPNAKVEYVRDPFCECTTARPTSEKSAQRTHL